MEDDVERRAWVPFIVSIGEADAPLATFPSTCNSK